MAAQLPDVILIHGEKLELYSNPLEQYWQLKSKRRPSFLWTAMCKRGYIATWEILDKHLILRSIDGNVSKRYFLFWNKIKRYTLNTLFPKAKTSGVLANWFTGKIRIPHGKRTLYVHHEYDSRFEKEMVITVNKGVVLKIVMLDYENQKLEVSGI